MKGLQMKSRLTLDQLEQFNREARDAFEPFLPKLREKMGKEEADAFVASMFRLLRAQSGATSKDVYTKELSRIERTKGHKAQLQNEKAKTFRESLTEFLENFDFEQRAADIRKAIKEKLQKLIDKMETRAEKRVQRLAKQKSKREQRLGAKAKKAERKAKTAQAEVDRAKQIVDEYTSDNLFADDGKPVDDTEIESGDATEIPESDR